MEIDAVTQILRGLDQHGTNKQPDLDQILNADISPAIRSYHL